MLFRLPQSMPPLGLREAVGIATGPFEVEWSVRDAILIALATGMTPQEHLPYLYEGYGPRVLPTLASVISGPWLVPLLDLLGIDRNSAVLGETSFALQAHLSPEGQAHVTARILGIDTRRKHACVVVESKAAGLSGPLITARTAVFLLNKGNEGWTDGDVERVVAPARPSTTPFKTVNIRTEPTGAAIYRLLFPLQANIPYADAAHIDPSRAQTAGFRWPALHGVTLLGIAVREMITALGLEEPAFETVQARFVRSVAPGDELQVLLWQLSIRHWAAEIHDTDSQPVVSGIQATVRSDA